MRSANRKKHIVYAEDIIWALMQYPDSTMSKSAIKSTINEVVKEKEVAIESLMSTAGWSDNDSDGDIYD